MPFTRFLLVPMFALGVVFSTLQAAEKPAERPARKPNIIYIMADDLGYSELGCFGQKIIRTPNIDLLANEGIKFTQHYAGAPVCAPSRCMLMTGKHPGHAFVRDNLEMRKGRKEKQKKDPLFYGGQIPIPAAEVTIAERLKSAGYKTAAIGKWGLGAQDTTGHPNEQGFDLFYGYLCQYHAHNHFPRYLMRNSQREMLVGNDRKKSEVIHSQDKFTEEALKFIQANKDEPFFLYLPFAIPHLSIQTTPKWLEQYKDLPEPERTHRGYKKHPRPHAGYAGMMSQMDDSVGQITKLIDKLGLAEDTIIIFTSDNGPTYNIGGADSKYFKSSGPFRGLKGSSYEGGLRVPMVARWKGKIPAGTESDIPSAFWDMMPTFCEIGGVEPSKDHDGISLVPVLLKPEGPRPERDYLYWEFGGYGGHQAVRMGKWKALRKDIHRGNMHIELYNLKTDIGETTDVSDTHPEVIAKIEAIMKKEHVTSKEFPLFSYEKKKK